MTSSDYQLFALKQNSPALMIIFGVIVAYLFFLKCPWHKRVLVITPSVIFIAVAGAAVLLAAYSDFPQYRGEKTWDSVVAISYILATAIIIFNLWYVRTWLHWLQVLNIAGAALSWFVGVMTVGHEWL